MVVAKINATEYEAFSDAISAANSTGATITLFNDVELEANCTISNNVIISGPYVIRRKNSYTGTLFTINQGAALTFKDGIIIDSGNNWVFDDTFYYDLKNFGTNKTYKSAYYTAGESGIVPNNYMIVVNGNLTLENTTIKNHYATKNTYGIFNVSTTGIVTLGTGAHITHNMCASGNVLGRVNGTFIIEDGTLIDYNHSENGNGGLFALTTASNVIMNGGTICRNTIMGRDNNGSGIVATITNASAYFTMNGGNICHNAAFGNGGWGTPIYVNRNGTFTMNGGIIEENVSNNITGLASNAATAYVILNGGILRDPASYNSTYTSCLFCNTVIGENMIIDSGNMRFYGSGTLEINGTCNGILDFRADNTVIGSGTYNNNIYVRAGTVTITEGTYNGTIYVENGSTLKITGGTFSQNVSQWCEDGYCSFLQDDGTWTICAVENYNFVKVNNTLETLKAYVCVDNEIYPADIYICVDGVIKLI